MNIVKNLAMVVLGASLVGCSTPNLQHSYGREYVRANIHSVSYINSPSLDVLRLSPPNNIDDIVVQSQKLQQFSEFNYNYAHRVRRIKMYLDMNSFSTVDSKVVNLAFDLRQDTNPFAQQYLRTINSFYYDRREEYTSRVTKRVHNSSAVYFDPWKIVFLPLHLIFALDSNDFSDFSFTKQENVSIRLYDIIRKWPVTGREQVLSSKNIVK
ncbi:MAG: hypothetical protein ACMXYG_04440 [Candidatus Woesearchaeota archaeon]